MADRPLRRTLMEHALESHREAAMYPMSIDLAQQLVADRRASYEAVAFRHHFRRYLTRHATHPSLSGARPAEQSPVTLVARHDGAPASPASKVA
jgi:hypothetical protein